MRIGVAGYAHETNTFSTIPVTREVLESRKTTAQMYFKGFDGVRTDHGGYIDGARELGIQLVPVVAYQMTPSAPTVQAAFEETRDQIVELLWQAHQEEPLDAIILKMHGAGVAEGYPDLEGEMLRAVRERFGNEIPMGMSLDLHGNFSQQMLELCDVTVGYKCYPHVDGYECGYKLVKLLHQCITTGKKLGKSLIRLPWILAPAFGLTTAGTGHDVQSMVYDMMEKEPGLLDITFFHGFCYADVPMAGASVVAMAQDQETADRCAKKLARYAWSRRKDFPIPTYSAQEAMDLAEEAPYPVVVNESSDNSGGGAPADGTHLLREMLKRNIPGTAYGYIYDPEVVEQAVRAGVGGTISCKLGAKHDNRHGTPIVLEKAYIKTISDGKFISKNPMGKGSKCDLKKLVLLVVGNMNIVVGAARTQTMDDAPFYLTGLDWRNMRILALKSSQHFKGWWADQAKTIIACDSPGIHSADLHSFDYQNININSYPFTDPEIII